VYIGCCLLVLSVKDFNVAPWARLPSATPWQEALSLVALALGECRRGIRGSGFMGLHICLIKVGFSC